MIYTNSIIMLQCSTWSNCRSLYRRLSSGNGRPGCCWNKVLSAGKLEGQLDPVWWLETAGEIGAYLGALKSLPFHTLTTIIKVERIKQLGACGIDAVSDLKLVENTQC